MSRVEYHDPDGLFSLIRPQLEARLPLRNLYWNSTNRPLRTIPSLNVDFRPSPKTSAAVGNGVSNEDIGAARRHQLAGLRSTPLLRVYLLQCDDKESYKSLKRPLLHDWLDNQVRTSSAVNRQEKHEACDWLILHVVLPNTIAASQPRWNRATGSDDEATKEKSASKRWPGKGSRGVFEKLRSDFGTEKKSETDHVAQIRLLPADLPPDYLPQKPLDLPADYVETPKERENAWSDFLGKLKAFILQSFDLRVSQYEDDIHAKDLQRNLPGWNFCTFFVLKEGLALAFEGVGLVEDALAIYDELEAGFDNVLDDHSEENVDVRTAFATCTSEVYPLVWRSETPQLENGAISLLKNPMNPSRKSYRELIAASKASIFDFKLYLCARRHLLLLRLAEPLLHGRAAARNGGSALAKAPRDSWEGPEKLDDMAALAKACQSAPNFITSLARYLRQELHRAENGRLSDLDTAALEVVTAAWTYAACNQFLQDTASFRIPETLPRAELASLPLSPLAQAYADQRSQTFNQGRSKPKQSITSTSREPEAFPVDVPFLQHEGLSRPAAYRADVCLLQRRILERVAEWRNWPLAHSDELSESIETDESDSEASSSAKATMLAKEDLLPQAKHLDYLKGSALSEATSSAQSLRKHYQELSDVAAVLYLSAGRVKSAERLMADVGVMKFHEKDFAAAAVYLGRVASRFAERRWNTVENRILRMHMACLRMLNRRDDFLRVGLELLAKNADIRRDKAGLSRREPQDPPSVDSGTEDLSFEPGMLFKEIAEYSNQLTYDLATPMSRCFTDFESDRRIQPLEDRDGFRISIQVKQLVSNDAILVDSVQARLISSDDGQSREIIVQSQGTIQIKASKSRVWLESNATTYGSYIFDRLTIRSGKMLFTWEALEKAEASTPAGLLTSTAAASIRTAKRAAILCYPRFGSLQASLSQARVVHINKYKSIELHLESGLNDVQEAQLALRSGSAGLRLRTADANVCSGNVTTTPGRAPGVIHINALAKASRTVIAIPYETETNLPALYVRLEVNYVTACGPFTFFGNFDIDTRLPLDVTVQDLFRENRIISKFFVRLTGRSPFRLLSAQFLGSESFTVQAVAGTLDNTVVFQQEPACVSYELRKRVALNDTDSSRNSQDTLPLTLRYRTVLQDVMDCAVPVLTRALEASPFRSYIGLVIRTVESTLRRNATQNDLHATGLVGQFSLPSLQVLGLHSVLDSVDPAERADLLTWLQSWHTDHGVVSIDPSKGPLATSGHQTLHIDFEVPHLAVLHTTSLIVEQHHNDGNTICIGDPLLCQIQTRFTECWRRSDTAATQRTGLQRFTYELVSDAETWAVCGPKRADFESLPGQDRVLPLTLIPLRAGPAALPRIIVKPAGIGPSGPTFVHGSGNDVSQPKMSPITENWSISPAPTTHNMDTKWLGLDGIQDNGSADNGQPWRGVCETDCITAGQTVQVMSRWKSSAVGLYEKEEDEDEEQRPEESFSFGFDGKAHVLESDGW